MILCEADSTGCSAGCTAKPPQPRQPARFQALAPLDAPARLEGAESMMAPAQAPGPSSSEAAAPAQVGNRISAAEGFVLHSRSSIMKNCVFTMMLLASGPAQVSQIHFSQGHIICSCRLTGAPAPASCTSEPSSLAGSSSGPGSDREGHQRARAAAVDRRRPQGPHPAGPGRQRDHPQGPQRVRLQLCVRLSGCVFCLHAPI